MIIHAVVVGTEQKRKPQGSDAPKPFHGSQRPPYFKLTNPLIIHEMHILQNDPYVQIADREIPSQGGMD